MNEHDFQLILVWGIVAHVIAESIVHFRTWTVLRHSRRETKIGPALESREFWKGWRYVVMLFFHIMLAWVVTFDGFPVPFWGRMIIYTMVMLVMFISSFKGLILIHRIETTNSEESAL